VGHPPTFKGKALGTRLVSSGMKGKGRPEQVRESVTEYLKYPVSFANWHIMPLMLDTQINCEKLIPLIYISFYFSRQLSKTHRIY